jgi:hypothetical protein
VSDAVERAVARARWLILLGVDTVPVGDGPWGIVVVRR